jgi:hypothetical protein
MLIGAVLGAAVILSLGSMVALVACAVDSFRYRRRSALLRRCP